MRDVSRTAFVGTPRGDSLLKILGACPCWLRENNVREAANSAEFPS